MNTKASQLAYTCKNCGFAFTGNYCNSCGEKVYTPHDKSIGHILEEGFHFITHFEGTFLSTLRTVLLHPGKLSEDYCAGIRKKYFKPISFFLLLVVLYLIFPVFKGLNMELKAHVSMDIYHSYAAAKIQDLMATHNWPFEVAAEKFQAVSGKVSKFLLLIIIPVMAFFTRAVLFRKKNVLFDHFIFSTEIASFFLLWGFLLLPLLIKISGGLLIKAGLGYFFNEEGLIGLLIFVPFLIYVFKAAKRFFHLRPPAAVLLSFGFIFVFAVFLLTVYKFLLFFISVQFMH